MHRDPSSRPQQNEPNIFVFINLYHPIENTGAIFPQPFCRQSDGLSNSRRAHRMGYTACIDPLPDTGGEWGGVVKTRQDTSERKPDGN